MHDIHAICDLQPGLKGVPVSLLWGLCTMARMLGVRNGIETRGEAAATLEGNAMGATVNVLIKQKDMHLTKGV